MSEESSTQDPKPISRLTIVVLLLVIAIAAAILFFLAYHWHTAKPQVSSALTGIASSLLASAVFATLYGRLAERKQVALLLSETLSSTRTTLEEFETKHRTNLEAFANDTQAKINDIVHSFYGEISSHFREVIPDNYFPPSDSPDKGFNLIVNDALRATSRYYFKGTTGRHVAARIESSQRQDIDCSVSILNPRMSDLLLLYIRDRFGNDAAGKESELLTTVRKEIYSAIVSLFDIRMRNAVEISFNSGPTFYRTEIFDDRLLVSLFIGKTATAYPATYLYRKDTFYYEVFMKDFLQARELSVGNVRFDLKTTERGLTQFLQFIDCPYCSDLRVLRRGAEEVKRGFISHL